MQFDAATAECLISTFREGLLAAAGHDVTLRATALRVTVGAGDAIEAQVQADSLRAEGVSPSDARDIERRATREVLDAARFPSVEFRSTRVARDGSRARVEGTLTLRGVARPIRFDAVDDGSRWRAELRLDQRDFGIRPYSAMLGALRVRADVLIAVSLPRW